MFCLFYIDHMQCYFFVKLLRTHIDYEDVYVKSFEFFNTQKYIFLT
jgi:hypothetical protein